MATNIDSRVSMKSQGDHALFMVEQGGKQIECPLTLKQTQRFSSQVHDVIAEVQWNVATWLYAMNPRNIYKDVVHILPKTATANKQQAICSAMAPQEEEGWFLSPISEAPTEHIGICPVCFALYEMNQQQRKEEKGTECY